MELAEEAEIVSFLRENDRQRGYTALELKEYGLPVSSLANILQCAPIARAGDGTSVQPYRYIYRYHYGICEPIIEALVHGLVDELERQQRLEGKQISHISTPKVEGDTTAARPSCSQTRKQYWIQRMVDTVRAHKAGLGLAKVAQDLSTIYDSMQAEWCAQSRSATGVSHQARRCPTDENRSSCGRTSDCHVAGTRSLPQLLDLDSAAPRHVPAQRQRRVALSPRTKHVLATSAGKSTTNNTSMANNSEVCDSACIRVGNNFQAIPPPLEIELCGGDHVRSGTLVHAHGSAAKLEDIGSVVPLSSVNQHRFGHAIEQYGRDFGAIAHFLRSFDSDSDSGSGSDRCSLHDAEVTVAQLVVHYYANFKHTPAHKAWHRRAARALKPAIGISAGSGQNDRDRLSFSSRQAKGRSRDTRKRVRASGKRSGNGNSGDTTTKSKRVKHSQDDCSPEKEHSSWGFPDPSKDMPHILSGNVSVMVEPSSISQTSLDAAKLLDWLRDHDKDEGYTKREISDQLPDYDKSFVYTVYSLKVGPDRGKLVRFGAGRHGDPYRYRFKYCQELQGRSLCNVEPGVQSALLAMIDCLERRQKTEFPDFARNLPTINIIQSWTRACQEAFWRQRQSHWKAFWNQHAARTRTGNRGRSKMQLGMAALQNSCNSRGLQTVGTRTQLLDRLIRYDCCPNTLLPCEIAGAKDVAKSATKMHKSAPPKLDCWSTHLSAFMTIHQRRLAISQVVAAGDLDRARKVYKVGAKVRMLFGDGYNYHGVVQKQHPTSVDVLFCDGVLEHNVPVLKNAMPNPDLELETDIDVICDAITHIIECIEHQSCETKLQLGSVYHGVTWDPSKGQQYRGTFTGAWRVSFEHADQTIDVGVFDDEKEAARAYDREVQKPRYLSAMKPLNFSISDPQSEMKRIENIATVSSPIEDLPEIKCGAINAMARGIHENFGTISGRNSHLDTNEQLPTKATLHSWDRSSQQALWVYRKQYWKSLAATSLPALANSCRKRGLSTQGCQKQLIGRLLRYEFFLRLESCEIRTEAGRCPKCHQMQRARKQLFRPPFTSWSAEFNQNLCESCVANEISPAMKNGLPAVNINDTTCTLQRLIKCKLSRQVAQRIIAARSLGPFTSARDLSNRVQALGHAKLKTLQQGNVTIPAGNKLSGVTIKKDPARPKRPMTAWGLFAKQRRPVLVSEQPNLEGNEYSRLLGVEWSTLAPDQRQPYNEAAEQLRKAYKESLAKYEGSITTVNQAGLCKTSSQTTGLTSSPVTVSTPFSVEHSQHVLTSRTCTVDNGGYGEHIHSVAQRKRHMADAGFLSDINSDAQRIKA